MRCELFSPLSKIRYWAFGHFLWWRDGSPRDFAMGVGPYINASIIMSLLQGAHVIPYLDRLAKEGEQGRKRMNPDHAVHDLGVGRAAILWTDAHHIQNDRAG